MVGGWWAVVVIVTAAAGCYTTSTAPAPPGRRAGSTASSYWCRTSYYCWYLVWWGSCWLVVRCCRPPWDSCRVCLPPPCCVPIVGSAVGADVGRGVGTRVGRSLPRVMLAGPCYKGRLRRVDRSGPCYEGRLEISRRCREFAKNSWNFRLDQKRTLLNTISFAKRKISGFCCWIKNVISRIQYPCDCLQSVLRFCKFALESPRCFVDLDLRMVEELALRGVASS